MTIEELKGRKLCTFCLFFLLLSVVSIYWGRDTFLKKLFSFPIENLCQDGATVTLTGQIYKEEQASDYQILYLKNNFIQYQEQCVQEPYIIVYDKTGQELCLGNIVEVTGQVSFYETARNAGGFSAKAYYNTRKIAACVWTGNLQCTDQTVFWLRERLRRFRLRWKELLISYAGEQEGGILCAIILGDRQQMDTEIKELYQTNGIAHILAISGLHLSFVGLGFYKIIRRLTGSYPLGGLAGITFLLLYILMIGSSVTAIRALLMYCIRVGADMTGRVYDAPTSVAVAAAVVILWRPLAFFEAGFQLSFGAVIGVLLVYPLLQSGRKKKSGRTSGAGKLKEALLASISIQLVSTPALLYHYCELPPYAILLNLVVIPLMSVVLAMGFLGSLLCLVWPFGGGSCLFVCRMILKIYELLCRVVSLLPGHRLITGQPSAAGIAVYYMGLLLFLLFKCRGWLLGLAISGLVLACPAVLHRGLEVTFLDVGQGDCIFLREQGGITCLIDGGSSDNSGVGTYDIEPFLEARGVSHLNYVFVTHGDSDHTNGLKELMERQEVGVTIDCMVFPERQVWDESLEELCETAQEYGIQTAVIRTGQKIEGKELRLKCLAPEGDQLTETGNAASLVLEGSYGDLDFLFTGDLEGQGEELLTDVLEKEYEVLKVAHHGSKNSTGEALLARVQPKVAIISAGRNNSYGHPHEETMERLREAGSSTYSTQDYGGITIRVRKKKAVIETYLN